MRTSGWFGASRDAATGEKPTGEFPTTTVNDPARDRGSPRAVLLYGATIFVSSFLLFQIQPIIAKTILPWFGGSAAVWTMCLLFFQVLLLGGYAYAHWNTRLLRPRPGAVLHALLIAASLLVMPIAPDPAWKPANGGEPGWRILALLSVSIGLPYLLLSTTSPLLQAWYGRAERVQLPYRLFALSNLASLAALLSYPVLVEPRLSLKAQSLVWTGAYVVFAILCAATAARAQRAGLDQRAGVAVARPPLPPAVAALWLALPACASILLVAVSTHLTQDVAPVPFLWVVPLALYLLSFILCFERQTWYHRAFYATALAFALVGMTMFLFEQETGNLKIAALVYMAGLFVACMFCHGEVARLKPSLERLTQYYLFISIGGALGGVFVGIAAPRLFSSHLELPIGLTLCAILAFSVLFRERSRLYPIWLAMVILLATFTGLQVQSLRSGSRVHARNFYGSLRVTDSGDSEENRHRSLLHGNIVHGAQWLSEHKKREPTTYFARESGVGVAIQQLRPSGRRVAIIGLGTGTIASFAAPGDTYRFYEINPLVLDLARTEFSFLRDCLGKVDVAIGDARLSMEREPAQNYDLLAVDAFSGDAIPVHLLTREAFAVYLRHLRPEGLLAIHVSNQYLNLQLPVRALAESAGLHAVVVQNLADREKLVYRSTWILLSRDRDLLDRPDVASASIPLESRPGLRLWTDDYSNLFQVLK